MFIFTTILVTFLGCYAEYEKRILLSDPQYSHGIEATLQSLTSRIDTLEMKHQADMSKCHTDNQILKSELKGNISQLESTYQNNISRLESKCHTDNQILKSELKGNISQLESTYQNNISRLESENLALNSALKTLTSKIYSVESEKGALYVRWGRTTCPAINGTEMVYTGYSGGSYYAHHGAAANHLCMPKDPEFLPDITAHAHVFGTEYDQNFVPNIENNDAPCSVCKSQRTSILMLPARKHCYPGWVMEYTGILAAGSAGQESATEYICLDSAPEALDHSSGNDDQNLLYFVSAQCGSLPCLPYRQNGVLPCVLCSK